MTTNLQNLANAFKSIQSERDFDQFRKVFSFSKINPKTASDVLGIYETNIENAYLTVTHRWFDRCRPFSIQPDGNKLLLEIEGAQPMNVTYLDDM
ncbi:MAG: hypothetical protein Q8J82_08900 [Methylotenera sp.]|nr:hypothetical protein [Methylotenera sp.]MDP2071730.1 hypothetical protein [Methylotenera sp.]